MRLRLAAFALLLLPLSVIGQTKPVADPLRDCEAFALAESKQIGGSLKAMKIERGDSLYENRFDRKVGSQYVSVEYIAWAVVEDGNGKRRARVVCLHTGIPGNKAVYVLEIPR